MSIESFAVEAVVLGELQRIQKAESVLTEMYRGLKEAPDTSDKKAAFLKQLGILKSHATWLDRLLDSADNAVALA